MVCNEGERERRDVDQISRSQKAHDHQCVRGDSIGPGVGQDVTYATGDEWLVVNAIRMV